MQFALISTYYLVLFIDLQGSGLVRVDDLFGGQYMFIYYVVAVKTNKKIIIPRLTNTIHTNNIHTMVLLIIQTQIFYL